MRDAWHRSDRPTHRSINSSSRILFLTSLPHLYASSSTRTGSRSWTRTRDRSPSRRQWRRILLPTPKKDTTAAFRRRTSWMTRSGTGRRSPRSSILSDPTASSPLLPLPRSSPCQAPRRARAALRRARQARLLSLIGA
jgi:hypothetical protein